MKRAISSSRPRAPALPIVRANSAARSGSNSSKRAPPRSSSAAGLRLERSAARRGEFPPPKSDRGVQRRLVDQSLSPVGPDPLQHLLDMGDRGLRLDAMTEVEDQPAGGVIRQHVVYRAIERRAAGDQRQRIKVALHRNAVLHAFADQ